MAYVAWFVIFILKLTRSKHFGLVLASVSVSLVLASCLSLGGCGLVNITAKISIFPTLAARLEDKSDVVLLKSLYFWILIWNWLLPNVSCFTTNVCRECDVEHWQISNRYDPNKNRWRSEPGYRTRDEDLSRKKKPGTEAHYGDEKDERIRSEEILS